MTTYGAGVSLGDNKNVLKLFQMKNIDGDDDCTAL
jgi:hypothetical protein